MNFKMGLSIWEWDLSLLVVKTDPSLPVAIQLNAFSGPALEATGVVVVSVDGSFGACSSDRTRFISTEADGSVLLFCNDGAIVSTSPCAVHILMGQKSEVTSTKIKDFRTIL